MTIIWPEIEISGWNLIPDHILWYFFRPKNFLQNGRNFCLPAKLKVENFSNLVIFWILRKNIKTIIWPEIQISKPIFSVWTKLIIFWAKKIFKTGEISGLRLNLKLKLSKFILEIHVIYWKIAYFRHFWRIFDIL